MAAEPLTTEMLMVFGMLGLVIFLFLVEWIRVDVVAILTMISLPMLGLVDSVEAFSGLSSTAVVSIIAVIIMGRGLDHTGVVNSAVRPLIKLTGRSRSRIVALLSLTIAFISSVMQNIGAAALFLPALRRISRKSGHPLAQLLMPIGFAAILGGTITLVGSSPLIMLNDLIEPFHLKPYNLFSVTPIGVLLVIVGIGYFLLFGRWVLPKSAEEVCVIDECLPPVAHFYENLGQFFEVAYSSAGTAPLNVGELGDNYLLHTVALHNPDDKTGLVPPSNDTPIMPGAVLALFGPPEKLQAAADHYGFKVHAEPKRFANELSGDYYGVVEAVVSPHSGFIGKKFSDINFRHGHLITPLALFREHEIYYSHLESQTLHPGDAVLMHGRWEQFQTFRQTRDLLFSHSLDHEILHPQKSGLAIACFALATALVIFTDFKLSVCLMAGALGMVLSGVISIDEAYRGVDWRTIFLLAGLIPLGIAVQKSGAAAWLAHHFLALVGSPSPFILLLILGVIATVFTLVVSNVGATVLLVPLVINIAQNSGIDPQPAALIVGIATSNSFLLPTHQVNALYMGPGNYKSIDFLKAGAPLSCIFLLVLTTVIYFFY